MIITHNKTSITIIISSPNKRIGPRGWHRYERVLAITSYRDCYQCATGHICDDCCDAAATIAYVREAFTIRFCDACNAIYERLSREIRQSACLNWFIQLPGRRNYNIVTSIYIARPKIPYFRALTSGSIGDCALYRAALHELPPELINIALCYWFWGEFERVFSVSNY